MATDLGRIFSNENVQMTSNHIKILNIMVLGKNTNKNQWDTSLHPL